MARKVFFSFHCARDCWRVSQVRNSNVVANHEKTPFYDKAEWETIKRQGDQAIKNWIDRQLAGTSVTVVLIGKETSIRRWVKYEIQRSIELGKGLIGVYIYGIPSHANGDNGSTDDTANNHLPSGYKTYLWNKNNGAENLGRWIEEAALAAGR